MAIHALSDHFGYFFGRLNPSTSFEQAAAAEHQALTALMESRTGPAAALQPHCFLQGSYRQSTAIYAINDVDIVALCRAWYPGDPVPGAVEWPRDEIFNTIAAAIAADGRYRDKIRFGPTSMVIHVDLPIKVEVLPVVYQGGVSDQRHEPFVLFRPERQQWEPGFARYHQARLTLKNVVTQNNFKPMIKVLKHLRSRAELDAVSFHLECLLYAVSPVVFVGGPADYITNVLLAIASTPADTWYAQGISTPCGDRNIFTAEEWSYASWLTFYGAVQTWLMHAGGAFASTTRELAIMNWQNLLGRDFFPATVTS